MMRRDAKGVYRPIEARSPIGRVLCAVLWPGVRLSRAMAPDGPRVGDSELTAAAVVERVWGREPELETRYAMRQLYWGTLLTAGAIATLAGSVLLILGGGALAVAGSASALIGAVCLGLAVPGGYRSGRTAADWNDWKSAGSPVTWIPAANTQPRNADLVLAGLIAGAIASLLMVLALAR